MRILVYPHELAIGGSQINAIDLAAGAAAAGHEVAVFGIEGPLVDYVREKGLRFIAADRMPYRPAPTRMVQLAKLCRAERFDLIHAYEWPPCLDAYYGAAVSGVPVLCTMLSMTMPKYIPEGVPLIVGFEDLADEARERQRGPVWCLEPPIDTEKDTTAIDGRTYRAGLGVTTDEVLIVSVSRLALDLKLDALVRAIDAIDILAATSSVRLALIGGGPADAALRQRAAAVNARHRREVVLLPGPTLDPREAYAAADIVVGMGSSAMRAASIGKPVVVQGEDGFSEPLTPETLSIFLRQGFYGLADAEPGAQRLASQLAPLVKDEPRRLALGAYGAKLVRERFSLERAIALQLRIYDEVLAQPMRRTLGDAVCAGWRALGLELHNHDPRVKRRQQAFETRQLRAASGGAWPAAKNA